MGLKWFARILIFFSLSGYILLAICQFTTLGYTLLEAQDRYMLVKISLAVIGSLSALSTFAVWGIMLYDWGSRQFENTSYKKIWFLAMIFGMFLGSWIYYFVVFEMGMNTKGKNERS